MRHGCGRGANIRLARNRAGRHVDTLDSVMPHGGPSGQSGGSGVQQIAAQRSGWSLMTELKVFIVEDNAVIRQNLVGALEERAPVKVVGHAEGATAAKTVLSAWPPTCDLATVDIFLRDGSGLHLLRMLNGWQHRHTGFPGHEDAPLA